MRPKRILKKERKVLTPLFRLDLPTHLVHATEEEKLRKKKRAPLDSTGLQRSVSQTSKRAGRILYMQEMVSGRRH